MRNFRQYTIWQDSFSLAVEVYKILQEFLREEKFGLVSQISRAAISIPSNIAEGSARSSDLEFKHFLEIALGSAFELETQLQISAEIGFLSKENLNEKLEKLSKLEASINSLITKLKEAKR